MASYFNLILDTLAPAGVSIIINDGAEYTTTQAVTLEISTSDSDTTGYQMKIWGIDGAETEPEASWETYTASKSVNLVTGDGQKTVYVKVRDDVMNESATVSSIITLNTTVPTVTIGSVDVTRISKTEPKNVSTFTFSSDTAFTEYKVNTISIFGKSTDGRWSDG